MGLQSLNMRTLERFRVHKIFEDRIEDVARNYQTHGALTLYNHCQAIETVSSSDSNNAERRVLSGKPTMVVTGCAINLVLSMAEVQRQLQ